MDENEYEWGGFLNGVTATPYGVRATTFDDWSHANLVDRENEEKARIAKLSQLFNLNIRRATGEFGLKYVMPVMMTLGGGPSALIPGLVGWAGAEGTNYVTDLASDGKYESWGQMMSDKTGTTNKWGLLAWEFTNPGAWLGGFMGSRASHQPGTNSRLAFRNVNKEVPAGTRNASVRMAKASGVRDIYNLEHIDFFKDLLKRWKKDDIDGEAIDMIYDAMEDPKTFLDPADILRMNDIGLDPQVFLRNFKDYVQSGEGMKGDLYQDTYYHAPLNHNTVFNELSRMGAVEVPVEIDRSLIGNFFSKDAYPKLMLNLKEAGINLTPELEEVIFNMYDKPWEGIDMKFGYMEPGSGGYSRGSNFIRYAFGEHPSNATVAHEFHHSLRNRLALYLKDLHIDISKVDDLKDWQISDNPNRKWYQVNRPEYTPLELDLMNKFKFYKSDLKSLTPTAEEGATLSEMRFKVYEELTDMLGRAPSNDEFSAYWSKKASDGELFKLLKRTSYGLTFGKLFDTDIELTAVDKGEDWANAIRAHTRPEGMSNGEWHALKAIMPTENWFTKFLKMKPDYRASQKMARDLGESYGRKMATKETNQTIKDAAWKVAGFGVPMMVGKGLVTNEE